MREHPGSTSRESSGRPARYLIPRRRFRRLSPPCCARSGESALLGWRPRPATSAVQMLEWWAYLADILTFYNERIANEDYLRTAHWRPAWPRWSRSWATSPAPRSPRSASWRRSAASRPNEALVIPAGTQLANTADARVPAQTFQVTQPALQRRDRRSGPPRAGPGPLTPAAITESPCTRCCLPGSVSGSSPATSCCCSGPGGPTTTTGHWPPS